PPTPAAGDKSARIATTAFVAGNFPRIYSINALPTQDVGPIIVAECSEVWNWMAGQYFTGYRSPLCGRPLDGHTNLPLASEVDATGGLLSKTDYAALWGYAQEQGLVKTEAVWSANRGSHWFSDYSATQFRVPDLRDMFRRFTGTDA
ncbi:phage tail protein, partial [Achromobacter xylosoxidans]